MELQQINQRIAVANAESKRLNNERQVLIGKRQTLEKQLSDALAAYKKAYGVELTVENIASEMERVSALKEAEVQSIETMLSLIKEGRYDEAERLAGGVVSEPMAEIPPTTEEPVHVQQVPPMPPEMASFLGQPVPAQPAPVQPVQAQQPIQPQVPPVSPAMPSAPVGVGEVPPAPPSPPPVVHKPTLSGLPVDGVEDNAPPAPPPVSPKRTVKPPVTAPAAPKMGVPPAVGTGQASGLSFQAILSGEAFNPQKGG